MSDSLSRPAAPQRGKQRADVPVNKGACETPIQLSLLGACKLEVRFIFDNAVPDLVDQFDTL